MSVGQRAEGRPRGFDVRDNCCFDVRRDMCCAVIVDASVLRSVRISCAIRFHAPHAAWIIIMLCHGSRGV